MKFLLTIYLCSIVTGDCVRPILEEYNITQYYDSHYECVQKGLGESYDLLSADGIFTSEQINEWELYPKFSCQKMQISEEPA
jgi:hypothetical protein